MKKRQIGWMAAVAMVLSLFCLFGMSQAQEAEEEITVETKQVQGEVSALSPNFIAVVYKRDKEKGAEYEIGFPVGEDIRLVHKKSLSEIRVGDTVLVICDEITRTTTEGNQRTKWKVKEIRFLRRP